MITSWLFRSGSHALSSERREQTAGLPGAAIAELPLQSRLMQWLSSSGAWQRAGLEQRIGWGSELATLDRLRVAGASEAFDPAVIIIIDGDEDPDSSWPLHEDPVVVSLAQRRRRVSVQKTRN